MDVSRALEDAVIDKLAVVLEPRGSFRGVEGLVSRGAGWRWTNFLNVALSRAHACGLQRRGG
ncbi:MAG: hypothetical protein ACPL3C_10370 [Pyrobaculum sp.]